MDVDYLLRPLTQSCNKIQSKQEVWDADPIHDVQVIAVNQPVN